jgi:hypothetical protein
MQVTTAITGWSTPPVPFKGIWGAVNLHFAPHATIYRRDKLRLSPTPRMSRLRNRRGRRKIRSAPPHSQQLQSSPQKYWRPSEFAQLIVGSPLAIVAFIYAIWGPLWPTQPSFFPGSPSFSSAFDVPFIVTNKSVLFSLSNLTITCQLLNFRAEGHDGSVIQGTNSKISARDVNPTLGRLGSAPFICPLRGLMGVGPAGRPKRWLGPASHSSPSTIDCFGGGHRQRAVSSA